MMPIQGDECACGDCRRAAEPFRAYRPSNGAEGSIFMANWCARCANDRAHREDPDNAEGCDVLLSAMSFNTLNPCYPREWREDGPSGPRCTAFVAAEIGGPEPIDPAAAVGWLL